MPVYYGRTSGTVWRHAHGSVLVLPAAGADVVVLSGTAEDLWQVLREPLTVEAAARSLADAYDESPMEVTKDISLLLDDLVARGVVDRVNAP